MKANYTRENYDTRDSWLNHRGIGGSSASSILNLSPWKTKAELWAEIINPEKPTETQEVKSNAMEYGTKCEDYIRQIIRLDFEGKYDVIDPNGMEMYRRIDKPYMTATLDGTLIDIATKEKGVLEIKTHDIRNKDDEREWSGRLPDNYFVQVMHYLNVMNDYTFALLVAKLRYFDYHDPNGKKLLKEEIRFYPMTRDEMSEQIEYLDKMETEFWESNVLKRELPTIVIK